MPPVEYDTTNGTVSIILREKARTSGQEQVHSLFNRSKFVSGPLSRVVLIGQDIELRIVSLVVRSKEVASGGALDTGSGDEIFNWPRKLAALFFPTTAT